MTTREEDEAPVVLGKATKPAPEEKDTQKPPEKPTSKDDVPERMKEQEVVHKNAFEDEAAAGLRGLDMHVEELNEEMAPDLVIQEEEKRLDEMPPRK